MSFSKDENSDLAYENVEQEDKVNVEEACVNLGYVKKEHDEEELEFEHKQYKIALNFENVFVGNLSEQRNNRDSLIGFSDGNVIMETGSVKLEDVKEENKNIIRRNIEQSNCNNCGGNYQGYCLNCSSLSHILNNLTPNLNPELVLNSTPRNMLEIREVSTRQAVFALKTLPKSIIVGPFEGIAPTESTTGLQWKIKDKKFVNDQNGNWMKYIESVAKPSSTNLDFFQIDGILYFETNREIQEGEELLVCYGVEQEVLKPDNEEFYLVPVKKEKYPNVFACTLCCLGFRLESCLVEHKSKCAQGDHGVNIEDFEIIQCNCCKVWLEKQEHLERHMLYCLENYNRLSDNLPGYRPIDTCNGDKVRGCGEISPSIDVDASYSTPSTEIIDSERSRGIDCRDETNCKRNCKKRFILQSSLQKHMRNSRSNASEKEYKCSEYLYQTNDKNGLKRHLNRHKGIKPFECDICKKGFTRKRSLKLHIRTQHSNISEKEYKCSVCSYQTNYKHLLRSHLNTHTDIKAFECDVCKKGFSQKFSLKLHIKNYHSNTSEKEYKCSECCYQTNLKDSLRRHLDTHNDIKPFECDICKKRFTQKDGQNQHIRNQHSNTNEKEYKCSECSYQTNDKRSLKRHLNTHTDIKPFECDICKKQFTLKRHLQMHIRNHHSNTGEKDYKCSECSYQTNYKSSLKRHLNTHNDIKPFECDICKKGFILKRHLQMHIINHHSNTSEKEYKCSQCSYQTNRKDSLKSHLNTHNGTKPFECDICKMRFTLKSTLKKHIRNQHTNTSENEYNCPRCSYQTDLKGNLKMHLNTHTDIKAFECDICKKGFTQKFNLKNHIRNQHSNTSEKDYKCSECPYQTNDERNFKRHLNTHTDIKPFECGICKQGFTQKNSLKLHIRNHHSNTSE